MASLCRPHVLRQCQSVHTGLCRGGVPVRWGQVTSWLDHYSLDELFYSASGGKTGWKNRKAGGRGGSTLQKNILEEFSDKRFQQLSRTLLPGINVPVNLCKKPRKVKPEEVAKLQDALKHEMLLEEGKRLFDSDSKEQMEKLAWENRYENYDYPETVHRAYRTRQAKLFYPGTHLEPSTPLLTWKPWQVRGFSGTKIVGRTAGVPETPFVPFRIAVEFQSCIVDINRVNSMTPKGRRYGLRAMVVVGNGNGLIGYGLGSSNQMKIALRTARTRAMHNLMFVERADGHTLFRNVMMKVNNCRLMMHRKEPGYGLACHRITRVICEMAGIKNMHAKIFGSTNPMTVTRATFKALTSQATHQDLADKTGKHVVEMRPELGYRPIVVASPSSSKTEVSSLLKVTRRNQPGMYGIPLLEANELMHNNAQEGPRKLKYISREGQPEILTDLEETFENEEQTEEET